MASFEITITGTIQAANEADAKKKKAALQALLGMSSVKQMVAAQGVTLARFRCAMPAGAVFTVEAPDCKGPSPFLHFGQAGVLVASRNGPCGPERSGGGRSGSLRRGSGG